MSWFHSTHPAVPHKAALLPAAFLSAAFASTTASTFVSPSAASAQDVGDRVRVFLGDETLIGRVAEILPDGFRMDTANGLSRSVSEAEIRWLERDVATGTNAIPWGKKGFLRGALGGAAVGVLLGLAVGPTCHDNECSFSVPEHIRAGARYGSGYAGIGGLIGGTAGLILGSMNARDEWQVIPVGTGAFGPVIGLRKSPDLQKSPRRSIGMAVGVRLRF